MTNHTPGEWSVCATDNTEVWAAEARQQIATCYGDEAEANARLIAACPAMFEALKRMMRVIENDDIAVGYEIEIEAARAALAQAEGEG